MKIGPITSTARIVNVTISCVVLGPRQEDRGPFVDAPGVRGQILVRALGVDDLTGLTEPLESRECLRVGHVGVRRLAEVSADLLH